jgi:two-component system, NtrC family, sensor histidine kinase AtoS
MGQAVEDRIRAHVGTGRSVFKARRLAADDRYQQARRALDLVRDSVVALDRHGRVTYMNHAAEELHDLNSKEIVGRGAITTLFSDNKLTFDTAWSEVLETGEWRGRIVLGNGRVVETHWSGVRDSSSRIMSVLIVSTEISISKLTAASLAHEVRNPLAGIKGVADAFLQGHKLTRREREWMETVRDEVMKIDVCMRELLDVSHSRVFDTSPCSLNDVISRVVVLATHQLRSITDQRIVVEFIDTTTEPVVMPLDSARVEDALLNLVLNAIESIDGDGRVTVCLRYRFSANSAGEALIEVTDTGCGIPRENRKRIFKPLFTTKREGTGLGLAAVRRTAAAYHGRVTFKTRVGRGSTFVLTLPMRSQPNLAENVNVKVI